MGLPWRQRLQRLCELLNVQKTSNALEDEVATAIDEVGNSALNQGKLPIPT